MLGHRTGPEQSPEPWRSLSSLKLFPQILSQGYVEVTTALSVVVSLRCKQKSPHWRLMSCSSGACGIHHQGEGIVFSGGGLAFVQGQYFACWSLCSGRTLRRRVAESASGEGMDSFIKPVCEDI